MTRKLIAGTGWKMNKTASETSRYLGTLLPLLRDTDFSHVEVFVLPSFTSLTTAASLLSASAVGFGGQTMHWDEHGAWTGEVSAPMLVEAGCRYVELGHSERRTHFGETDEAVSRKVQTALRHHLTPIVCIGETQTEQAAGDTEAVLKRQIAVALSGVDSEVVPEVILAYEPRWAIGQSEAAAPEYIGGIHRFIRRQLAGQYGEYAAGQTRVIYGGSVNLDNAEAIIELAEVDGLFVGRAALVAEKFAQVVKVVEVEAIRGRRQRSDDEDRHRL